MVSLFLLGCKERIELRGRLFSMDDGLPAQTGGRDRSNWRNAEGFR
jgi:hypothetical protein